MKKIILLILMGVSMLSIEAKEVKLGKEIYYSGELSRKVPYGEGKLFLKQYNGRNSYYSVTMEGTFDDDRITNAHIVSEQFEFYARNASYQINKRDKTITFVLSGVSPAKVKTEIITYSNGNQMNTDDTSYSFTFYYTGGWDQKGKWELADCPQQIIAKYRPQTKEPRLEVFYYNGRKDRGKNSRDYYSNYLGNPTEYIYDCGVKVEFVKSDPKIFNTTSAFGTYGIILPFTLKAKDGSIWSDKRDGSKHVSTIHYADGREYIGTVSNYLNISNVYEEYGVPLLKEQPDNFDGIAICNGTMKMPDGEIIEYVDGKRKGTSDLLPQPYLVKVEGGNFNYPKYVELYHRTYDDRLTASKPEELRYLIENDAASYYQLPDITTPLQKKVFSESEKYQNLYLPRLMKEKDYLMNDEFVVAADYERGMGYLPIEGLEYDMNSHRYTIELRDTKNAKINNGESNYRFLLFDYICLTYPKSLVSLEIGQNYLHEKLYIQRMKTCIVPEEVAVNFEKKTDCRLLFIFKFEKIKDGCIYGKTTKITLVNKKTGETCDLTESLNSGNGQFQSVKVHKDNTPKKVYHSRGKMEDCGLCLGTGKGWQGGTCIQCGGKGWYIEHYW